MVGSNPSQGWNMALVDLDATLAGTSSGTADLHYGAALLASLVGTSSGTAGLSLLRSLAASLVGTSSGTAGLSLLRSLAASLVGTSSGTAEITWTTRAGSPSAKPSSNSAATLQQFVDSVGVSKKTSRTPDPSSTIVDLNPPRKPFKPR